jgi:predicted ATP-grasp superfamily ATP-dependent carboligase
MTATIIIWGPDNYNALGLLRQLSTLGIPVLFLLNGKPQNCATKSIHCKHYIKTDNYKIGLQYLVTNFDESLKRKSILIPIGDRAAEIIDQNRNVLCTRFHLMGTQKAGVLSKIDNKNEMTAMAESCGFLVPKSIRFKIDSEVKAIPMPCILKPTSTEGIREFKTKVFYNISELIKFKKYLSNKYEYILQELIPKTKDILVYGCRMNDGEVILAGQFIKDRWSDDGGGSHGLLTNELPDYLSISSIEKFLSEIDYKGLFSIEYGLVGKKAYFYEFNLRNDGTSHLFYQAGANLPMAWVNDCLRLKRTCSTKITRPGWNINEIYDIANVFHGRLSYGQYKKDKSAATIFHYYDKDDLKPWKYARKKAIWDIPLRALLLKLRPQIIHLKQKLHI